MPGRATVLGAKVSLGWDLEVSRGRKGDVFDRYPAPDLSPGQRGSHLTSHPSGNEI